jgi:hypothetical protein
MAHITLACKQITLPAFFTMLVPPFPFTTYFVALIFILTSKRTLETIHKECLRNISMQTCNATNGHVIAKALSA